MADYSVKAAYKTGDFEFCTTIKNPGKSNNLSASFFHSLNSSTTWGCLLSQGKGDSMKSRPINGSVGAEFKNNSTMTTKFAVDQDFKGQFKVAQVMDSGATLTLQTKVDLQNPETDPKFGLGFEMSL